MAEDQSASLIDKLIVPMVIYILGIVTPSIKRFFYKPESFKCAFKHPKIFEEPQYREVRFYKRFGKTYKSDCPWFGLDKIKGYEKFKHPYCPFGQNVKQIENIKVGSCPFSNIKIVQDKI